MPRFTCNISNTIHFEEETNKTIKKEIIQSDFEILNSVKKICKQIFHYALFWSIKMINRMNTMKRTKLFLIG